MNTSIKCQYTFKIQYCSKSCPLRHFPPPPHRQKPMIFSINQELMSEASHLVTTLCTTILITYSEVESTGPYISKDTLKLLLINQHVMS